jgi:hypothetical protein
MKTFIKRAIRDEKGAGVLALVLVLLVVGGLILTPLLGLMSTGLMAGQVYEKKTDELYAADAGVEDAIWRIQTNDLTFDANNCSEPWHLAVNNKSVEVVVYRKDWDPTCGENFTYQILSTAVTNDDGGTAAMGSSTLVDAYLVVSYLDLSSLLEHAIISNGNATIDVNLSGKTTVNGTIWLPNDDPDNYKFGPNVEYDPDKLLDSDDVQITWPEYDLLSTYYLGLLDNPANLGASINIQYTHTLPDSYRDGELTIDNTGDPATLTLDGNLYVANGDLLFAQSGESHNYTINLNHNTIFVAGEITAASQIRFSGSGCVIAKGDITCQPGIITESGEFVLIMSVTGDVRVNPAGDFTGCIAGGGEVDLQPNGDIEWISPADKGLDYPIGAGDINELPPVTGLRIESWEINPQ